MRNTYIKLLEDQPKQNFGNKNTKINIHIPIRGDMLNYCIEANEEILKITNSGVDFRPDSFQIPHITLYMGFVRTHEDFKNIMEEIYSFSKELESFEIFPTKAYLKEPKKNYIFIDTEQSQRIIELKKEIKNTLNKYIEPLTWDVVNETPHITIGYIKNDFYLVDDRISNLEIGPSFWADAIEVSFGGPWGSCIGTIRTFEFGK
jgi:2'-5' RNA ligase